MQTISAYTNDPAAVTIWLLILVFQVSYFVHGM